MARIKVFAALICTAALVAGCSRAPGDGNATEVAATALDETVIAAANARWLELIKAKDAAGIAQLYAEDGVLMPPNMPIAKGRAAIQKGWADMMALPGFDLTFATEQLSLASGGDMALDRGTYRFAATPNGAPYAEVGKFVVVWRKVGGEWKVAADIFNSDRPATAS
ncbi:MAG TPA: DUF4440 domain-containing protein [Sphingomicrobium sp.]|nr:DUF4440 domain-containing protein [Sphingomicrobium sp.]